MSSRNRSRHRSSSTRRSKRRRLLAEPLEDRRLLAVSFEFNYLGGNAIGFNDPAEGDTFRAALQSAADRLGGWILQDATVQMDVSSHPFDGTAVAKATSERPPDPAGGGFVHGVIPSKILGQGDLNDAAADGRLEVYFFGASDDLFYATDPADVDMDDEVDFQAVMIHELVHTLGFTSATNADGSDDSGQGISTPGTWSPFDQFVSDVDGNRFIDADPDSSTAFQMDTTAWATHSVGGKGPDAGLFFDGPIAKAVYGGRVPLYSPATFSLESSVSHLDSEGFPDETSVFSPLTHLMSHVIVDNVVPQELTLLEKAILADIGIQLAEDVAPTVTAPGNLVLEGNSEGGFLGLNQELLDYLNAAVASDLIDPSPTITHNKPAFLPLGQNTITFTATDASGNVSSADSIVSVFDTIAPAIDVTPTSATLEATGPDGVTGVTLPFVATVSDIVDPNPLVTFEPSGNFPIGNTTVTYTARDFRNNVATFDVDVIVQDTTAPEFTLPAELTIDSNLATGADLANTQLLSLIDAAATDVADTMLAVSADVEFFPFGTTTVAFTVTDDSGNATMATTSLTVNDVSLVVTTLDDEQDADPELDPSDLSLREAISLANEDPDTSIIRFDETITGTVSLDAALGQLQITESVSVFGLGRDVTSIDAQGNSRVIEISGGDVDVTLDGMTITGGQQFAESQGGAGVRFRTDGTLTISNATVSGNSTTGLGAAGAGVQVPQGNLVLVDTIVSGNQTTGSFAGGAGVWTGGGEVSVTRSTVTGNSTTSAYASGAGLYVLDGVVTISESTFAGNSTQGNRAGGAGLALLSTDATIRGSTISGNSTSGTSSPGGGLRALLTPLKLVTSTVSGNTAGASSAGGGVYADRGDVDIDHSTITGNEAEGSGGGIAVPSGSSLSLTIHNSIVAGNTDDGLAPDFIGAGVLADSTSVEFSLIGNNTGTTLSESQAADPTTGNIVGDPGGVGTINPLLSPLADNGGPTQTHLLQPDSPAVEAGDPQFDPDAFTPPLTNDQRGAGFPRVFGDAIDIGATERLGSLVVSWLNPADIVFGTPLGAEQLNATANVPGSFQYTPSAGTVLNAGNLQQLSATFTPDDLVAYDEVTLSVVINVLKAEPDITWADPDPISFGTALDGTQLNAESSIAGTFVYTPPAGTVLEVGEDRPLSVTFTPTETDNYTTATASVVIDVLANVPVVTWENPDDISFGTPLSSTQLNATANVPGSFSYVPPAGVLLSAGPNQTLTAVFTASSPGFETVSTTVSINVIKADPVITWDDPGDIVAGIALDETQLNATANASGTFTYDPSAGTLLGEGAGQELTVTFTPQDQSNFNVGTATASINVIAAQDFGDAPSRYPVLLADDGPRHPASTLRLGSGYDVDIDGSPSPTADGDGVDDDGVLQTADLVTVVGSDTGSSFAITASAAGKLDAWIDFNNDGDWNDTDEQIFAGVDLISGENILAYSIPSDAAAGQTAARFRLSSSGGLAPTGSAPDGEVEDYLVTIMDGADLPDASVELVDGAVAVSVQSGDIVTQTGQTVLFRSPLAGINSLSVVGTSVDESVTLELGDGFAVPSGGLGLDGGLGGNTLVMIGDGGEIDLTDPLLDVTDFRRLDLSSDDANTVTIDAAAVVGLSPALRVLTITAGPGDRIIVENPEDWRITEPITTDGKFLLTASNIAGGDESIEAELPHAWRNFVRYGDVNNNGDVTATDALRIINELSRREFSDRDTQELMDPLTVAEWPGVYFDHNGDNHVTALDALRVINDMARLRLMGGPGEAERVVSLTAATPATIDAADRQDEPAIATEPGHPVDARPPIRPGPTQTVLPQVIRSQEAVAEEEELDRLLADPLFLDDLLGP